MSGARNGSNGTDPSSSNDHNNTASHLHDREAEQRLLGSLLHDRDGQILATLRDRLQPVDFYVRAHQDVYRALCDLQDQGIDTSDVLLVGRELIERDLLDDLGGPFALTGLAERVPSSARADDFAGILLDLSARRRALDVGARLRHHASTSSVPLAELVSTATEQLEQAVRSAAPGGAAIDESAKDLLASTIEPPPSYLGDGLLVAPSLALLAGRPGLGKSWLSLDLALAVASGTPWLGMPTREGRVGIVARELGRYQIQKRLLALEESESGSSIDGISHRTAGLERLRIFAEQKDFDLAGGGRALFALQRWVRTQALELVILDPLSRCHNGDENDTQAMGRLLAGLERIARQCTCCILLVHHERKGTAASNGKPQDDMDAIRGSSRLLSDPSLVLRLKEERGLMRLVAAKSNHGPWAGLWLERTDQGILRPRQAPPSKAEQGEANEQRVFQALAEGPRLRQEIQEVTDLSSSTVREHLRSLIRQGKVVERPGHRYEQLDP